MVFAAGTEEVKVNNPWDSLKDDLFGEIEQSRRELSEISLMLDQSQVEVNKLTQKNAVITSHLQQVFGQFDTVPRSDIRSSYDAALDAQQRLFVMRGQIDKLQSDRDHLERYKSLMERVVKSMEGMPAPTQEQAVQSTSMEMFELLIQAQEAERQRLARQMHDEPAQALSNFILQTEIAMRLFDIDPVRAKEELSSLKTAASVTFQKVRDFIFQLRPMMLDDLGLIPTLNRYIEAFRTSSPIEVRLNVTGTEQRLEPYQEVMIFRAIQELLGNAVRHCQGTLIKVQIDSSDAEVRVTVDDNGKGFDADQAMTKGMGLKLIHDRVEMLNGEMEVDSVLGQGTRVSFRIPAKKTKVFA
jgi:two-component system sensor histidine kinase DegS